MTNLKMKIREDEEPLKPPLSDSAECCRSIIYCFNVFYTFTGVALIAIGIWVQLDPVNDQIALIMGSCLFKWAGKVVVAAGIIVLVVSLIGCLGCRFENRCLLIMYFFLLLLVFVVEFAGGTLGLAFLAGARPETMLTWSLRSSYGTIGGEHYTAAYDYIQRRFRCCGVKGNATQAVIEYRMTAFFLTQSPQLPRRVVPESCCREGVDPVICQMERPQNQYRLFMNDVGCLSTTYDRMEEYGGVIGGFAICISLLQLLGMVFAFCLFKKIPVKHKCKPSHRISVLSAL